MSLITNPTITDNTVTSMYSENLSSIHDVINKTQVINQIYNKYGDGANLLVNVFRTMKGVVGTYAGNTLNAYEKGKIHRTITTEDTQTGGATAGSVIYIKLSEDDIDSDGNIYPALYDNVLYQHTDNKYYPLQITAIADDSASGSAGAYDTKKLTLKPYDNTLTIGSGTISSGTELTVLGNNYAHGTGQPSGKARGYYENTFKTAISKSKKEYDGAEFAYEKWVTTENGVYSLGYADLDWEQDMKEELNVIVGDENDNSLTMTSPEDSASRSVRSTKGLWHHLEDSAGKLNYGTSGDFDLFYLDDVDDFLRQQKVTNSVLGFYMGSGLFKKMEKAGLEFIKEYSGGTDLTTVANKAYGGSEDNAINAGFSMFKKNGNTFVCNIIGSFSDPDMLGNSTYDFKNSGFIAPLGDRVKVKRSEGQALDLPNVGVMYRSQGDTNRKRVVGIINGMSGWNGAPIIDENDVVKINMLSEYMLVALEVEKMLQVNPR